MTIGIPGGHFFFHLYSLSVIPGSTGNPFQKSSKPFKKRKTFFQKKKNI
jgi:hypothetical protein